MTGGQDVEGQHERRRELTHSLHAEGVRADHRSRPRTRRATTASRSPPIAEVRDRDELLATQRELAQVAGVTVLIHDQACAAELRRAAQARQGARAAAAGR